jgi:Ohr subfamily peroxiredoxin
MKLLYTAQVTVTGGRDGSAQSSDGNLKVQLSMPKDLGGAGLPGATNPEQLFAAGYGACFESAIRFIARSKKITISELKVEATVSLTPAPTGFALLAGLHVLLPGMEPKVAEDLVVEAHKICPYSNATRGNLDVQLAIN